MILEPAEKQRFCEWLRMEIASNDALSGPLGTMAPAVGKAYEERTKACRVVLKILEGLELQTVKKGGP